MNIKFTINFNDDIKFLSSFNKWYDGLYIRGFNRFLVLNYETGLFISDTYKT
jgi:hypothetical protein